MKLTPAIAASWLPHILINMETIYAQLCSRKMNTLLDAENHVNNIYFLQREGKPNSIHQSFARLAF